MEDIAIAKEHNDLVVEDSYLQARLEAASRCQMNPDYIVSPDMPESVLADLAFATQVANGERDPYDGGAELSGMCDTVVLLDAAISVIRAQRDAAISERDSLKADAAVGKLVRALPVGWALYRYPCGHGYSAVDVRKGKDQDIPMLYTPEEAMRAAYADAGIEVPNA